MRGCLRDTALIDRGVSSLRNHRICNKRKSLRSAPVSTLHLPVSTLPVNAHKLYLSILILMAVLESIISLLYSHALILLLIVPIIHLGRNYFTPGARSVPGPFFAKLTNLWRFIDVAKGRPEVTLYRLHKKHGDYVRLGPNVVSVRNLEVLKEIYGINKGYQKVFVSISLFPAVNLSSMYRYRKQYEYFRDYEF